MAPKKKIVETIVDVAKSLPKALEANKAVQTAKDIEKKIDAILDKPKITAADAKKVDQLSKQVDENLKKAVDLGASTSKNSPVTQVSKAVKAKVEEVKAEAPKPAAATKAAPKAEEAPGPSNLPKSTPTKTPPKTAAKTPEPSTTKTPSKTPSKTTKPIDDQPPKPPRIIGKIDDLPKGLFPGMIGAVTGAGVITGAPDGEGKDDKPKDEGPKDEGPKDEGPKDEGPKDDKPKDDKPKDDGPKDDGPKDEPGDGTFDPGAFRKGEESDRPTPEDEPDDKPDDEPVTDNFDTTWLILKAKLLAAGLPESTVDASVTYFRTIIKDARFAGPNELENVVDQYLYLPTYQSKAGTTVDSPFYKDFGKFNEKLTTKKKPGELVGLVLGYKRVIDKYVTSETARTGFKSDDSITKYMQNDVSVAELDERANAARLRSINADPFYVKALMELKYISAPSDLTAFFLDPSIGTKALEDRRTSGVFATEAIRRSSEATGISLDTEFAKQQAAKLTGLGYTEAQITQLAGQGYENIAEQLRPTEKLSGIYERNLTGGAADAAKIQQELQAEQFLGTASQRRKKLAEQEVQAFRGQSGLSTTALRTGVTGLL